MYLILRPLSFLSFQFFPRWISLVVSWMFILLVLINESKAEFPSIQFIATRATEGVNHQQSNSVQIVIISELMGYIEPCGCTIDLTLGAIERLSAEVKRLRSQGPTILITAGSQLFEHDELKDHSRAQEMSKARLINKVFTQLNVDAHLPGPRDLIAGLDFYRELQSKGGAPEVTLNDPILSPQGQARLIERGGVKIGVFGVIDLNNDDIETSDKTSDKLDKLILDATQNLKVQGAQALIGLAITSRAKLRKLAEQNPQVDLWVLSEGAQEEKALSPVIAHQLHHEISQSYIIEAGDRGRNLAVVRLSEVNQAGVFKDPLGDHTRALTKLELKLKMKEKFANRMPMMRRQVEQIKSEIKLHQATLPQQIGKRVSYRLIPVNQELPIDEEVAVLVKHYQDSLQELNQEARKLKPPPKNGNGYAGRAECGLCHPDAQEFWEKTRHSHAWETLVKANKTFDVECVGCHVTGWQAPGGSALGHTEKLQDVQCEACHGPASKHAEVGGGEAYVKLKVPASTCQECHNQKHSPKFDYQRYLKKIIGPGHGLPLPTPIETP